MQLSSTSFVWSAGKFNSHYGRLVWLNGKKRIVIETPIILHNHPSFIITRPIVPRRSPAYTPDRSLAARSSTCGTTLLYGCILQMIREPLTLDKCERSILQQLEKRFNTFHQLSKEMSRSDMKLMPKMKSEPVLAKKAIVQMMVTKPTLYYNYFINY